MRHANVALFVPHNGCPHQCSFCNQRSITGKLFQPSPQDVLNAVNTAKSCLGSETKNAEIAFFGGSFTAIERSYMESLLFAAAPFVEDGTFCGIRVSTRPDCIDKEILGLLKRYHVTVIELGAQSMDNRVLALNGRGHTAEQVEAAAAMIQKSGFSLGLQMMTGLYGDTAQGGLQTAEKLAALHPDSVRIYPTIIMRGTQLGEKYLSGEFQTLNLEDSIVLCAELLDFFEEKGIPVIRLGLHSSPELERDMLSGPWHPAFRELCESRRFLWKVRTQLREKAVPKGDVVIRVNPKTVSIAVGQKKANINDLKKLGYHAVLKPDHTITEKGFIIEL